MKRFATIALVTLLSLIAFTAAAQAQIQYDFTTNGRAGFYAIGLNVDDVYAVSATINTSSLSIYAQPSGSPLDPAQVTAYDAGDGTGEIYFFIVPPPSGGTVNLTATLLDPNGNPTTTILTGSKLFGGTGQKTATTTSLSGTPLSQVYGAVVLTANVSPNSASGSVTFKDNGNTLSGLTSFSSGVAILHAEGLLVGASHSITAVYSGDATYESSTSSPITLTVTQATLTINGITADSKVYDGGTAATLHTAGATLQGNFPNDDVSLSTANATGTFADKDKGIGKTVSVTGATIGGGSAPNYTLTQPTTTADISPKALTVTGIAAIDKIYDGTANADLNTSAAQLSGIVGTENVNLHANGVGGGSFADKNVGTSKPVIVTGIFINGPDAGNYTVTQPTSLTASISKANASVAPLAATKVYGTSDPVLTGSLSGFVGADNVTATYSRAAGETVAGSPYTISAALSPVAALDNYNITSGTAAFTITKAPASVTPIAVTKVYGTPDPTLTGTLTGFVAADNVTATYTRTTGETVVGSPYTISATLNPASVLPNYDITYNTANFGITTNTTTTALGSSAATSVYGQPVTFTATVSGAGAPSGTVSFKDGSTVLGTGTLNSGVATLSISTLQVAGSPHSIIAVYGGDGNFAGSTSSAVQQTVTTKALTVGGITASNKIYDGNTTATLNTSAAALSGAVAGDDVSLNSTSVAGNFNDKNIGTTKPVAVTGLALAGTAAGNYSLTQPTTTANITAKNLTVTGITASDKVYDGTTTATLNTSGAALVGVASGDNVALSTSGAVGTFADKEIGTAKTVTITGLTLSGNDVGNYTLTQPTATASITAPPANTGSMAGAGWVSSAAGAYVKSATTSGRGYFAFAAAYIGKNPVTPTGLLDFQLKTKGLFYPSIMGFTSTQFEVLVVSGSQATLKGTGSLSGSAGYGFLLSVIDGQGSLLTGNKLRLKIWDKNHGNAVVYDNQMGAADDASPTGAVTGLIAVSKSGGSTTAANMSLQQVMEEDAATEIPTQYELYNAYPNPFNPSTTIMFDLPEVSKVRLVVYDMLGREVALLADGERPAGHYSVRFDAGKLSSGMYIYRLQTNNYTQTKKLMLMK